MAAWYVNDHYQARMYRKWVVNTAFLQQVGCRLGSRFLCFTHINYLRTDVMKITTEWWSRGEPETHRRVWMLLCVKEEKKKKGGGGEKSTFAVFSLFSQLCLC